MKRRRPTKWVSSVVIWDFRLQPNPMIAVQEALVAEGMPELKVNLYRLGAEVTDQPHHAGPGHSQIWLAIGEKEMAKEVGDQIYDRVHRVIRPPKGHGGSFGPTRGLWQVSFAVLKRRGFTRVESAMIDCALIANELGARLDIYPRVYQEVDIYEEPTNSIMPVGCKQWKDIQWYLRWKSAQRLSRRKLSGSKLDDFARKTHQVAFDMALAPKKKELPN